MNKLKFHHVGIVTKNIQRSISNYPFAESSVVIEDENQNALISFLKTGSDTLIEFVQPLSSRSQTYAFSLKGGGYHHTCFQIGSLDEFQDVVKKYRMVQVSKPVPAIAMGGADIVFCYSRDKQLFEFVIASNEIVIHW